MTYPVWGVMVLVVLWASLIGWDVWRTTKYRRWERAQALKYLQTYPPKRY